MADKIKVKFLKGTSQQYNAITPDELTFYYLTDLKRFYLGSEQLTNQNLYNQLLSAVTELNARIDSIDTGGGGGSGENYAFLVMKTTAQWRSINPMTNQSYDSDRSLRNTFYVYSDRGPHYNVDGSQYSLPGIKIGDGLAYIKDLPFIDQYVDTLYQRINTIDQKVDNHINDNNRHVRINQTINQRQFWNNKITCRYESTQQVDSDGILIFSTQLNSN